MNTNMLKSGQFAIVNTDCAVRKGERVELVDKFSIEGDDRRHNGYWWKCWFNGIKIDIKESNLTPEKPERWKPKIGDRYWCIVAAARVQDRAQIWEDDEYDNYRYENYNVFKTCEERDAEAQATLADRKARMGE